MSVDGGLLTPGERKTVDWKGTVRVTLRMQWETTIASYEALVPVEEFETIAPEALFQVYGKMLWRSTVKDLKDRTVERMLESNDAG